MISQMAIDLYKNNKYEISLDIYVSTEKNEN